MQGQKYRVESPDHLWDLGPHKDCVLEYRYVTPRGVRAFLCVEHQLWVFQHPKETQYVYGDNLRPVAEGDM